MSEFHPRDWWQVDFGPTAVCDICDEPMRYHTESGCCTYCTIEWDASHQLEDRQSLSHTAPEAVGLLNALKLFKPYLYE